MKGAWSAVMVQLWRLWPEAELSSKKCDSCALVTRLLMRRSIQRESLNLGEILLWYRTRWKNSPLVRRAASLTSWRPPPIFPPCHSADVLLICTITSYGLNLKYPCSQRGQSQKRDNWSLCGRAPAAILLDGYARGESAVAMATDRCIDIRIFVWTNKRHTSVKLQSRPSLAQLPSVLGFFCPIL